MKAMKKLFLVLLAMLATFAFVSCKDDDDDDKSVSMTFTLIENRTYTIDYDEETDTTSYIFTSNPVKMDGDTDTTTFFLYLSDFAQIGTGAGTTGKWMFGFLTDDEDIPLIGLYKGNFVDTSKVTVLNRTHIVNSALNWSASAKAAWKSLSITTGNKYFKFTLTESDINELEKIFPDEE